MANVCKSSVLFGLSGSIGDMVFRQMPDGSTRVSRKPDFRNRKFSQAQLEAQARFKQAASFAREASRTQPIYAAFSRGTTTNAYNLALSDWFNPPVIHRIERRDGLVHIVASDNVLVTEVRVKITDSNGNTLEQGQAERADSWPDMRLWRFHSAQMDLIGNETIEVTACDLAGNQTRAILYEQVS